MGAYLERLSDQFDTITDGIDTVLNRAADENRDVTADEAQLVEREQAKLADLSKTIEHYAGLETTRASVLAVRAKVPATVQRTNTAGARPDEYRIADDFPDVGTYMQTIHRAQALRDPDAMAKLERATAHQVLADNPGIVPRPIVQPVISLINDSRPFISSITNKPLPAGSFDRPIITQHVAVGVQAAEKDLTASQKLLIGKLPVAAKTYAGHLNISRQDIKWTQPGILNIVAEDFAAVYAVESNEDAAAQFKASVAGNTPVVIDPLDGAGITAALFAGAAAGLAAGTNSMPDTLWVSPDVWGQLGGLTTSQGALVFPSLNPGSTTGNTLGLRVIVDAALGTGTMIQGPSRYLEWYEDVDGLLQVAEPDVLGQLVGYAGFGAFLNVAPSVYTVFGVPPVTPLAAKSGK